MVGNRGNVLILCPFLPGATKSNPLQLFAAFSATAWNFNVKFYLFMWLCPLHLTAKRNLIIFKYNEVTDILVWPPSDFCVLKNVSITYHNEMPLFSKKYMPT